MIIYDKYSSYRRKSLFLIMILIHKACYPTILNLSIVKEKISLELLDNRHKSIIYAWFVGLYIICEIYFYQCVFLGYCIFCI